MVRRITVRKDYQFVGLFFVANLSMLICSLRDTDVDPKFCESLLLNDLNDFAIKLVGNIRKNGRFFVSNTIFDKQVESLIKDGDWAPVLNSIELKDVV